MQEGYENVRPYWEAWKANNARPSDPREAANWDGIGEIFRAVAMGNGADTLRGAVDFILNSRPRWLSQLKSLPTWDEQLKRLKLYRGIRNEDAIRLRKALRDSTAFFVQTGLPISYSTEREVALGFASKGHIAGCVYSVAVTEDSVIFSDLDCHYQDGWLHREKEVVVWHPEAVLIQPGDLICTAVPPIKPLCRTRTSKAAWDAERKKLEEMEKLSNSSK